MSIFDKLYDKDDRHWQYSRDTNIFLNEVVATSKRTMSGIDWEIKTGYSVDTPVKELPTRVFKYAAKLLACTKDTSIALSRLSKLAIDRAVRDRKEQAYYFKVLSTRSEQANRIYDAHIYFIKVLEYMGRLVRHLFEKVAFSRVVLPVSRGRSNEYGALIDWSEEAEPEPPSHSVVDHSDEAASLFWSIIYDYANDVLDIRAFLKQLFSSYERKEISLLALYPIIHVAFHMIEERTTSLFERKSKLDTLCPQDVKWHYEAHGIAGVLHYAFQEHDSRIRAQKKLIDQSTQAALAQIGLDHFFAPTVAKILQYRTCKSSQDSKYLDALEWTDEVIPFGDSLNTENGRTLTLDNDSSLYEISWYEDAGNVLLREYSRMASLDCLIGRPRFLVHDALTGLLGTSLLGSNKDQEDLLSTCLLHLVLDMRMCLAGNSNRPYNEARMAAQCADDAYNRYYQLVTKPSPVFKDAVDIARKMIIADPMAITPSFGAKRMRVLGNADPVLAGIHAHLAMSAPNALKRYNAALSGRFAYAVIDGPLFGTAQLEKEGPNIVAFLLLYAGLKATGRLSDDYEDAEQIAAWYGEKSIFGTNCRPRSISEVLNCFNLLLRTGADWSFLPITGFEEIIHAFITDESAGAWKSLRACLVAKYESSSDMMDDASQKEDSAVDLAGDAEQQQDAAEDAMPTEHDTKEDEDQPKSSPRKRNNKRKTAGRVRKEKQKEKKTAQKQKRQNRKPPPTDFDLLHAMKSIYTKDLQLRACFSFLRFRSRVTHILIHCAESLIMNHIVLPDEKLEKPDELLHFVHLFFKAWASHPDVWSRIADEIVAMIKDFIKKEGRKELDWAEEFCGFGIGNKDASGDGEKGEQGKKVRADKKTA